MNQTEMIVVNKVICLFIFTAFSMCQATGSNEIVPERQVLHQEKNYGLLIAEILEGLFLEYDKLSLENSYLTSEDLVTRGAAYERWAHLDKQIAFTVFADLPKQKESPAGFTFLYSFDEGRVSLIEEESGSGGNYSYLEIVNVPDKTAGSEVTLFLRCKSDPAGLPLGYVQVFSEKLVYHFFTGDLDFIGRNYGTDFYKVLFGVPSEDALKKYFNRGLEVRRQN